MDDDRATFAGLLTSIERLVAHGEASVALRSCTFFVGNDLRRRVTLQVMDTEEQARSTFQRNGSQFIKPKQYVEGSYRRTPDGVITDRTWAAPPPFDPPIESNESLPNLGDENYIWRQHASIKLRLGRFLAIVHMTSIDEAERWARRLVALVPNERTD